MKTLLISFDLIPIRIIPWERAIKMRYEGTVEVLKEYKETVRSPSTTWRVPAVVKAHGEQRIKHAIRFSRANVYLRDKYRCQYCANKFEARDLSYDHVVPRCEGGKTNWRNIVTCCKPCNTRKGGRDPDASGMFPINRPIRPTSLPAARPLIDMQSAPLEWLSFLQPA